jgi:hypothetical protein
MLMLVCTYCDQVISGQKCFPCNIASLPINVLPFKVISIGLYTVCRLNNDTDFFPEHRANRLSRSYINIENIEICGIQNLEFAERVCIFKSVIAVCT